MNEEPTTFKELRQMIEDARKISIQVLWNDGLGGREYSSGTYKSAGDTDYI